MKTTIFSFLTAALFLSITATAQYGIGPEGGLNISNYLGFTHGDLTNTRIYTGGRLGGVMQSPMGHHFYMEHGLYYVMNGYKQDINGNNVTFRVNTAELPLNLLFKFNENEAGDRIFVGLGPYVAFNFGGRYKVSGASIDRKLVMGSDFTDDLKVVDFGVGVNAGYQVANGVFIRAHVQMGAINLKPYGDDNNAMYNTNYGVSVGYLFLHDYKCPESCKSDDCCKHGHHHHHHCEPGK